MGNTLILWRKGHSKEKELKQVRHTRSWSRTCVHIPSIVVQLFYFSSFKKLFFCNFQGNFESSTMCQKNYYLTRDTRQIPSEGQVLNIVSLGLSSPWKWSFESHYHPDHLIDVKGRVIIKLQCSFLEGAVSGR